MRHTRFNHVYRAAGIGDCTGNGITARFVMLDVIYDVPYDNSARKPIALAMG